jgi:hypothetical protein
MLVCVILNSAFVKYPPVFAAKKAKTVDKSLRKPDNNGIRL